VRPEALTAAILRQAVTDADVKFARGFWAEELCAAIGADYDLYREKVITLREKYDFETEKRREKP
jgi:phage gp46-like protein